MDYGERSRTSSFNTIIKKNFGFLPINVEISSNAKTRLQGQRGSLVFVLKLVCTFIGRNSKFFFKIALRMFYFSPHSP
jgi:hypothetical protein